jgi:murein DD-endopeptidase MepM/ murein hydrolase activator NlpD
LKRRTLILIAILVMTSSALATAQDFTKLRFIPPLVDYRETSPFGYRGKIVGLMGGSSNQYHVGIDMASNNCEDGAYVLASADGEVFDHYPPPNGYFQGHKQYGGMIVLYHGDGIYTRYAHMKETFVHIGQKIHRGDIIGVVGSTGVSTGPHLHFEVLYELPPGGVVNKSFKKSSTYVITEKGPKGSTITTIFYDPEVVLAKSAALSDTQTLSTFWSNWLQKKQP